MSEYGIILENDKNEKIVELLRVLKIIGENKMEENKEVKKCKFCGAELKGDVLFCTNCGKKVEEEEKKVCAKCGAELSEDAKFCPKCGEKVITSIICPKCGKELQPDAKFCQFCGENLNETCECPKCHVELPLGTKFCPECGCNIQNTELDDDSDDEDEYDNYDSDDDYYEEDDYDESDYSNSTTDDISSEEKIKKIVNKYIKSINKDRIAYNSEEIKNIDNSVLKNIKSKIIKSKYIYDSDILGVIDISFGNGKEGLVFTPYNLYVKTPDSYIDVPYTKIYACSLEQFGTLKLVGTAPYCKGFYNYDGKISDIYFEITALKDCLEEIKSVL